MTPLLKPWNLFFTTWLDLFSQVCHLWKMDLQGNKQGFAVAGSVSGSLNRQYWEIIKLSSSTQIERALKTNHWLGSLFSDTDLITQNFLHSYRICVYARVRVCVCIYMHVYLCLYGHVTRECVHMYMFVQLCNGECVGRKKMFVIPEMLKLQLAHTKPRCTGDHLTACWEGTQHY